MSDLTHALALAKAQNLRAADALYAKLLAAKPKSPAVLKAVIQFHNAYSRQFRAAIPLAERLVSAQPKSAAAHALAAETFSNCQDHARALDHATRAVALAPRDPHARFIAAVACLAVDQADTAQDHVAAGLAQDPTHLPCLLQKTRILRAVGDGDGAADQARQTVDAHPNDPNALELYVTLVDLAPGDATVARLRDDLAPQAAAQGGQAAAHLLSLLSVAHTRQGDHRAAVQAKVAANRAHPVAYPMAQARAFYGALRQITKADFFGRTASDSTQPVLVVGMPRSGSTLVQQVLGAHPDVATVGESPALRHMTQQIGVGRFDGAAMTKLVKTMPADVAPKMAARYLAASRVGDSAAPVVIDKSLHNFELLGFWGRLFPKAPVIHVVRDPLDCCTSIFLQRLSTWHAYARDMATLGQAFVDHMALMDHWMAQLPNPVLQVTYEDLVAQPEATARRMLDHLSLPWDRAVLDFHTQGGVVHTLSDTQVRQPLNDASIGRWRRYDGAIDPLKAALRPLYPGGV